MDLPDTFLAFSKILNYLGMRAKLVSFAVFLCVWTYFRHYLNIVMLWSVWTQFDLMPYVPDTVSIIVNDVANNGFSSEKPLNNGSPKTAFGWSGG